MVLLLLLAGISDEEGEDAADERVEEDEESTDEDAPALSLSLFLRFSFWFRFANSFFSLPDILFFGEIFVVVMLSNLYSDSVPTLT